MKFSSTYGYCPKKRPVTAPAATSSPLTANEERLDMTCLPLTQRLAIAEDFVAANPGRAICAMLLDLFPELHHITKA